ncbi:proactivator polypeptide-like 1 [Macadamia integrifolia]|uniref:proactivator polypeptide-like 1 n=1 Tax=Macadamia integrifolia TaxID=60698 RepID=UPI001C4F7789|nr:proactivator polypeptide-like 1 [Macadamia integrifolia]XP_042496868.1 proactivator polypeptide-like 1 [Macadamia integrifolia]
MNMRIVPLLFALLVSLLYVDARHVFSDSGKLADIGVNSVQIQPVVQSSERLSPEFICLSCLEVSKEIVKALSDPLLLEKVSTFVNDACHILPSDIQVKCVEMLETNINQAIVFLKDYFSEENLCNSTGLCPSNANTLPMLSFGKNLQLYLDRELLSKPAVNTRLLPKEQISSSMLQKFTNKMSDDKSCDACHTAIKDIRNDLKDPKMKIKVMRILLKACENVDNNIKECKRMVLKYGPLILENLEKYLNTNDLCSMAHICKPLTGNNLKIVESFRPLIELPTSSKNDALSK